MVTVGTGLSVHLGADPLSLVSDSHSDRTRYLSIGGRELLAKYNILVQ